MGRRFNASPAPSFSNPRLSSTGIATGPRARDRSWSSSGGMRWPGYSCPMTPGEYELPIPSESPRFWPTRWPGTPGLSRHRSSGTWRTRCWSSSRCPSWKRSHAGDPGRPRWLLEAYERLADMPRGVPSVVDLAEEVGVHPDHLIRAFRTAYGETPGVFARRRRARVAAQLVCGSDRPLSGIAWTAGYADQSHMTREFGRFFGRTPGCLRRSGATIQ